MKRIIIAVAAVLTMVTGVAVAEDKATGSVYLNPASKYVFRGIDLSEGKPVMQGGVDVSYNNFTVSYWSNEQMKSGSTLRSGDTTETDITLNYTYTPVELLTLNLGNTYYTLSGLPNTNEVYLKATLNKLLSPTLAVYYDWDKNRNKGLFYTLSIGHTVEMSKSLGLNLGALASYNMENPSASSLKYSNLDNYELSASMDYSVGKFKISPNYLYSNAFNSTARLGGVKNQSIIGLKAAFVF